MRRSSGLGAAVCALVFLFVLAPSAGAATFVVNTTDDVAIDGCTTAAGGCSLREALTDAANADGDDAVTVPAGRYTLDGPDGGALIVQGEDDVTEINGAGAATTIIDAEGLSGVIEVYETATMDASGVTITGGAPSQCPCASGGGVLGYPGSTIALTDARVTKNFGEPGGGVSTEGGTVDLSRTEVDHNVGFAGGGVSAFEGDTTITDSWIHANQGIIYGGGVYSDVSSGSSCDPSCALGPSMPGPFGEGGDLTIADSTVSDNVTGAYGGGVYYNGHADAGSTTSSSLKGTFDDAPSEGSISNSTVSGNASTGGLGGGVYKVDSALAITSSTIVGNHSVGEGGAGGAGVHADNSSESSGTTTIQNTVLSDNRTLGTVVNCGAGVQGTLVSGGTNLESADSCPFETAQKNVDAKLGALQDNGGPAPTHALGDGSPAIDTADTDDAPELDQRGGDRPPADGSAGAVADVGAYEAYSLADLAVEAKADGPDPATVGGRLTYTIVVRNNGPDAVNGVTVADAVAAGVTRSAVGDVTGGGSCSTSFVCEWQRLDSGQVVTAALHTTPTVTGIASNSATVAALGITDPEPSNNSASAATLINPAGTLPPNSAPPGERELDDAISVDLNAPKTVSLDTFFKGITVTSSCTDELCIRKFREHASINTGATSIAGFNLTVSRTSLGYTAKKKVRLRPCLSGSTTGRRHRRCMKNLRKAAEKAAPFRVKIVVEAVDRAGNRDAKKVFLRVKP